MAKHGREELCPEDLEHARTVSSPSIMIGLDTIKPIQIAPLLGVEAQEEAILSFLKTPAADQRDAGLLIHGPSGTGKSSLTMRSVHLSGRNIITSSGASIRSKYVGQSEKNLAELFQRARDCAPSVLLLEQIETLFGCRDASPASSSSTRLISCFLTETDGIQRRAAGNVLVIATSKDKELVDPAMLRPGRLGTHVALSLPSERTRELYILNLSKEMPLDHELEHAHIEQLLRTTSGWCLPQLRQLFEEAAFKTLRHDQEAQKIKLSYIVKLQ